VKIRQPPPEKIMNYGKKEDSKLLMLMHLSVISYILVIPIGNILIPLIFWVSKKD